MVLTGTIGFGVSYVFGQNFEPPVVVPPSQSGQPTQYGTAAQPRTAATPPNTGAVGSPVAAQTASPPYGYSGRRRIPAQQPLPVSKLQWPNPDPTASPRASSSGVQQAIAVSSQPGWPAESKAAGQMGRGKVTQTGLMEPIRDPNIEPSLSAPPDISACGGGLFRRPIPAPSAITFPDRGPVPSIRGSHLQLQPGETATERSLRLMSTVGEMERQLEALQQRNAELSEMVRQRDEQLMIAVREIKSTRKDVSMAREELEHLRDRVRGLQEKVAANERDNDCAASNRRSTAESVDGTRIVGRKVGGVNPCPADCFDGHFAQVWSPAC